MEKTFVPLLKVREVAEYLGVPVQTLYDWRTPAPPRVGRAAPALPARGCRGLAGRPRRLPEISLAQRA